MFLVNITKQYSIFSPSNLKACLLLFDSVAGESVSTIVFYRSLFLHKDKPMKRTKLLLF